MFTEHALLSVTGIWSAHNLEGALTDVHCTGLWIVPKVVQGATSTVTVHSVYQDRHALFGMKGLTLTVFTKVAATFICALNRVAGAR